MEKQNKIRVASERFRRGDYVAAWSLCQSVLQQIPSQPDCLLMMGIMGNKAGRYVESENFLRLCLSLHPQRYIVLTELATTLICQNNLPEAASFLKQSFLLDKQYSKTYIQQAKLFKFQGKVDEAEQVLKQLLMIKPKSVSALNNLGTLLVAQNKTTEALQIFKTALALKPLAITYKNVGLLELKNGNSKEALRSFVSAHQSLPTDISILLEIGKIYFKKRYLKKGLLIFKQILKLDAGNLQAMMYLGITYSNTGAFDKSAPLFEKILLHKPYYSEAFYELARCKSNLAVWSHWEQTRNQMIAFIERDLQSDKSIACSAFDPHYYNIPDSLQYRLMQGIKKHYDGVVAHNFSFVNRKHHKIRIGYMSPDFRAHALGMSVYQMFKYHDRQKFEVYTFSVHTPNTEDEFYKTIMSDADHAFDVSDLSAKATAQVIYDNEIDILIDFGGYTRHTKPDVLVMKPAPVQIMMCGQPDTTAISQVDYFISDKLLIDEVNRKYYNESIVYLPHGFINSSIKVSDKKVTRKDLGIGEDIFLFCSFCSPYKYEPKVFALWMKLLGVVKDSVLWLLSNANPTFEQNIRQEATRQGIDASRILFANYIPIHDHLNRMEICDLFLDTQYYSSCSSASHALMMALPVLTLKGETNAKRQGASVCVAARMDEMVCNTMDEYYNKAIELTQSPQKLADLKNKIKQQHAQIPLFNMPLNVSYIERAYNAIWKKQIQGEPCTDIEITDNKSITRINN